MWAGFKAYFMPMPAGRPTDYDPALIDGVHKYIEEYEPFTTNEKGFKVGNDIPCKSNLVKFLRENGYKIGRTSLWEWELQHPEFAEAIKKAIDILYPESLQRAAMLGAWDKTFAIFSAKNRMGWSDKQEVDHVFREPILVKAMSGEVVETLKHG